MKRTTFAVALGLLAAGCASGMGGGPPIAYRIVALNAPAGAAPDSVAAAVKAATADLALVASRGDSAWYASVARATGLHLTGPGRMMPVRLGFLGMKPVGDTTVTLSVGGGRTLPIFDALYQPQKHRSVDLMLARVDTGMSAQAVAGALVKYFSTDVSQGAALVLGVLAPTPAVTDSIASRVRAIFVDLHQCGVPIPVEGMTAAQDSAAARAAAASGAAAAGAAVRLFYGPETTIRCDEARLIAGPGAPVYAHFTIGAKQP
ncbi:MAG TPA: hypothetical protein VF832_14200 [Longimicrobiales bacterium]